MLTSVKAGKRICFERPRVRRIKVQMKSTRLAPGLPVLAAALLSFLPAVRADMSTLAPAATNVESMASIFSNSAANHQMIPDMRTSIIYIQCHGLGYGDLSCYGQTNFQTPNLDKLAAQGIRFTNFRPGGNDFKTALGVLVSGKKTGAANATTVADDLQAAGYHTGLIGEWTLNDKPWTRGFDEFAGFLGDDDGRNYFAGSIRRFAPHSWLTQSNSIIDYDGSDSIIENEGGKHGVFIPQLFANAMNNFVRIHKPDAGNGNKPFFLLVDLPAPRSAAPNADQFPVPSDAPFSGENWPQAAKDRAALITRIDGSIGELFAEFRTQGMSNNIAIFFSSSEAPAKFKDAKLNFLKPNGAAVAGSDGAPGPLPMIVWCPEQIPAGQVSEFKWSGVDFLPTALEMSYARPVKDVDGMSVLPVLRGVKGAEVDRPVDGGRSF